MKKQLTYADFWAANLGGLFRWSQTTKPRAVFYPDDARDLHRLLFGGTGAGKTTLLNAEAIELAIRKVKGLYRGGFAILSPHPDFFREVRDRLALLALQFPELYDLIYILDVTNEGWSMRYNPTEIHRLGEGESIEARADETARLFAVLYGDDITVNVRQQRVMANTFLAMMLDPEGGSLPQALEFLAMEDEYRENIVRKTRNRRLIRYWCREFKARRDKMELIESSMNRLERFVDTHSGVRFFLEGPSTFDFLDIMNKGGILLVNGNKGKLKGASSLFLGFVMSALQNAAMERLDMSEDELVPFTVFGDEAHTYVTDTVREAAKESRKVKVNFTLATQSPKDLAKNQALLEVVRDVVGNVMSMRLNRGGAEMIAQDIFASDLVQEKAYIDGKPVFMSLNEIQELDIRKLTSLPPQMVWWKRIGYPAQLIRTPFVQNIKKLPRYKDLPAARRALELAAFRLAGQRKLKLLPAPLPYSFERSPESVNGGPSHRKKRGQGQIPKYDW